MNRDEDPENKSDVEKLRMLADWFDVQQEKRTFPEHSDSRTVQQDLRRMADKFEKLDENR